MIEQFKTYNALEYHDSTFNIIFSTVISSVISIIISDILAGLNFFNASYSWVIAVVLILNPIIVLIAVAGDAEFKTAYYKTWKDSIMGVVDQKKVLNNFAKQYKIENWQTKIDKVEADGRWNFHAETNYMRRLIDDRNMLVNKIYEEYIIMDSKIDKDIILAEKEVIDADIELDKSKKNELDIKELLDTAKTPGEIYKQRQEYNHAIDFTAKCKKSKNYAESLVSDYKKDKEKLAQRYKAVIDRVKKIYNVRYSKYTERVIKKINKINGLKFTIADMPDNYND